MLRDLHALRQRYPARYVHLLYTPELGDTLQLIGDSRREAGIVQSASYANKRASAEEKSARLITLDCRRVAAYLLESDAALDDPLLEASITQACEELCLASRDPEVSNDDETISGYSIGGWLVSEENANRLASRLRLFSRQDGMLVRWTNPMYIDAIWPTMKAEQRFAMLGETTWIAFDGDGVLHAYNAGTPGEMQSLRQQADTAALRKVEPPLTYALRLDEEQNRLIRNIPLVRDLLDRWHEMYKNQDKIVPADAQNILHKHISVAQDAGLDPESVAIYCMTIVQLHPDASGDSEWTALIQRAANFGLPLRDLLDTLPDTFWNRYSLLA